MKKKIISSIAALSVAFGGGAAFAADIPESTQIQFRIGDSDILINGETVTVETPYIEGTGTTLVPLRVITEAFGAEVEWEGETQTITLTYPDVSIVLQIGNSAAQVNDYTQKLDVQPTLSANGVTMVPLRFISETFGADVEWDDGLITVTKTYSADDGSTISGGTETAYIGDSYYGWSMQTPTDMFMEERGFGGLYTVFTDNYGNELNINVYANSEDTDIDETFAQMKEAVQGVTLIKADKLTDSSGHNYIHIQFKVKDEFVDERMYYSDSYHYGVMADIDVSENNERRDAITALMDTFKAGSFLDGSDITDLANINSNGTRTFEDEDYGIKFNLPLNWSESQVSADNVFVFYPIEDDDMSYVYVSVYSKSSGATAKELAQKDYDNNVSSYNSSYVKAEPVAQTAVNGINGYSYTLELTGTKDDDNTMHDMFFDIGDYVYNISVVIGKDSSEAVYTSITNSLELSEPDADKIGKLIRNDSEDTLITAKATGWSAKVPASWSQMVAPSSSGAMWITKYSSVIFSVTSLPSDATVSNVGAKLADSYTEDGSYKKEENGKNVTMGGKTMYRFVLRKEYDDSEDMIMTVYVYAKGSKVYVASMGEDEPTYGARTKTEFDDFVSSLEVD